MAQQLTEFGVGISLDDAVQIIYGNGVPGGTTETDTAPVGSSYSDVATGAKWQKITNVAGPSGWIELAGKDAAIMVQHISSTGVILDQVPTRLATEFAWMVTAYNEADPSNKYSTIVHMSHNGTATADATNVTYDQSSILRQGAKIGGLTLTGTLVGAGADQFMNLHVSSNTMVTFIAYRMVKNISGSNTVILGGANLDNHVADGSVHLTAWQNTLLDGVSQSLTATQVNSLVGVTSAIQTQINAKASSASLATVATSGAYGDLSGKPTIPTVPTAVSSFTNDSGYQTASNVTTAITAAAYSLPTASASALGGVKVGSGLSIDGSGVLSAAGAVSSVAGRTGAVTISGADLTSWAGAPYDIAFPVFGAPTDGEVVFRFKTARAFTLPANFAGAIASAGTASTGASVFAVKKNGTQVATISFGAGGVTGTYSTQAAISFSAGDAMVVTAPATADATLADIDFTMMASLA